MGTDVAAVVSWDAAAVDDNGEDHEADDGGDLDDGQDKFDWGMSAVDYGAYCI